MSSALAPLPMAEIETMDNPARRDASAAAPRAAADGSAGALLRAAREGQGMHIATLAAAIKVAPRKLEALEGDRWDELPGPTFTRALAQAVCRALKTDPQPVMDLLPPADTSMLDSSFGSINEPFAQRAGRDIGLPGWLPRGPWLIAALLLLLAAAVVMWMPAGTWAKWFGASRGGATGVGGTGGEVTASISLPPPAASPTVASPSLSSGGATVPAAPSADAPAAQAPAMSVSPAPAAAVAPAAPAGALVISCRARSWVEVTDGRGRVLLSRNLEAGESIGLDGWAPLQLVIGNAEATSVTYKGAAVDLAPNARDNVARVELR